MKRMIYILGSVGMLLMASSAYGQNYLTVLKENMELKSEISDLKGELTTKNSIIKRLKDLLVGRNAEIREMKSKLLKLNGDNAADKYKNKIVPKDVLYKAILKNLGPTKRQGVDRIWRVDYFPIGRGRVKTCLIVDWALNDISQVSREAITITKTISEMTERYDYLILRSTAAKPDNFGRMTEYITARFAPLYIPNPLIVSKEVVLKINWAGFDGKKFNKISFKKIDPVHRDITNIINRDRRFILLPKTNKR